LIVGLSQLTPTTGVGNAIVFVVVGLWEIIDSLKTFRGRGTNISVHNFFYGVACLRPLFDSQHPQILILQ